MGGLLAFVSIFLGQRCLRNVEIGACLAELAALVFHREAFVLQQANRCETATHRPVKVVQAPCSLRVDQMQGDFQGHQIVIAAGIILDQGQANRHHGLGRLKFQQVVHVCAKGEHILHQQCCLSSRWGLVLKPNLARQN